MVTPLCRETFKIKNEISVDESLHFRFRDAHPLLTCHVRPQPAVRYGNFALRVGFAYAPAATKGLLGKLLGGPGKTSIRGGYGMFYSSIEDATGFIEVGDALSGAGV